MFFVPYSEDGIHDTPVVSNHCDTRDGPEGMTYYA